MKVLAVFVLFFALAAAVPAPPQQIDESKSQTDLLAADVNAQGDNAAERSKRFIFFSKFFYPYPFAYTKIIAAPIVAAPVATPVVTPIVTKTKVVAPAPVSTLTYQVRPVTYQYTIPSYSYSVVKAVPAAVQVQAAIPSVQVTKTVGEATVVSNDEE